MNGAQGSGGGAGSPPPGPAEGHPAPGTRPSSGGGKGCFGCLGCLGLSVLLLVGVPVALLVAGWFFLPTLVAPPGPAWEMPPADAQRAAAVGDSLGARLARAAQGGRATVELTEGELNQLLAAALRFEDGLDDPSRQGGIEDPGARARASGSDHRPQGRLRVGRPGESPVQIDLQLLIPEVGTGLVTQRLAGQMVGVRLGLQPRAAGSAIALRVEEVRTGRIPLPVGLALRLLSRTDLIQQTTLLTPRTGELRLSIAELVEGATVEELTVEEGRLRLELVR